METICKGKYLFHYISDFDICVSVFVLLNKIRVFMSAAPIDPERNIEILANLFCLTNVLQTNWLTTHGVVCQCHNHHEHLFFISILS